MPCSPETGGQMTKKGRIMNNVIQSEVPLLFEGVSKVEASKVFDISTVLKTCLPCFNNKNKGLFQNPHSSRCSK